MRSPSTEMSLLVLAFVSSAAACGGGNEREADPDAQRTEVDGAPDAHRAGDAAQLDAGEPGPFVLRPGRLVVSETKVLNAGNTSGNVTAISFLDRTTSNAQPVAGFENPVDGCAVFVYDEDSGEGAPDAIDGGEVTVTGTLNGPYACAYTGADGYACQSTGEALRGGVAGNGEGVVLSADDDTLVDADATFTAEMTGMHIALSGFPAVEGTFPIVSVLSSTSLELGDIPADDTGTSSSMWTTYAGRGAIPGFSGTSILHDDTEVHITKPEMDAFHPELALTFMAAGRDMGLEANSGEGYYLPDAVPTTAAVDVAFHCGVNCGNPGSGPTTGGFTALVIHGRTTDAPLPSSGDPEGTAMPPPVSRHATFECMYRGESVDTAAIPADAMAAILGTDPTRIEIRVGRFAGDHIDADDLSWSATLLVGHSITGYTTP